MVCYVVFVRGYSRNFKKVNADIIIELYVGGERKVFLIVIVGEYVFFWL